MCNGVGAFGMPGQQCFACNGSGEMFEPATPSIELIGSRYRIVSLPNGYEPQMRYTTGTTKKVKWFPINAEGYWLEPKVFDMGVIEQHLVFAHKATALEAIAKAQKINNENDEREILKQIRNCDTSFLLRHLAEETNFDAKLIGRMFELAKERASEILK